MKIIPHIPYDNNSFGEKLVFEALETVDIAESHNIAFHSVLLTSHERKRVGEADFVIIGTFGLFVIEVKGGRIKHQDGIWSTENKHGRVNIQDPFKQASGAVHAINSKIKELLKIKETRIPLGYAVAFPNSVWKQAGAEWDREMICDSEDLQNFGGWLEDFFEYWNFQRPANANLLSRDDVDAIAKFLRPNFEVIQPLFDQIRTLNTSSVRLTEEQYHYVDIAMDNPRVICSGGAGTGKTFLAAEMARRFIANGKNVLLACKSTWLKHYLSTRIKSDHLVVSTVDGLSTSLRRSGGELFDVLIVDEGQDLLNQQDLAALDRIIKGGFENGNWYFFHDANNQADLFSKFEMSSLELLKSSRAAVLRLNVNCRNTSNILDKIQDSLQCDLGKSALIEGPEVTEYRGSIDEQVGRLTQLLDELISSEVDQSSITILSPSTKRRSLLSKVEDIDKYRIDELDDYKVRKYPFDGITFAEIKNFKGLENDIIILLDLPDPDQSAPEEVLSLHYVGMSRARVKLYCFWSV